MIRHIADYVFNMNCYHVLHFNISNQNVKHLAKSTLRPDDQATTIKKYLTLCTFHYKINYKEKLRNGQTGKKIKKVPFPSDKESSESALQ